jgi:hypothetical protein
VPVDAPTGTPGARSCRACKHDPPQHGVVQGLEVSRDQIFQNQIIQAQIRNQPLQPGIFLLKIFQPSCLIDLQATVFFAPG